MSEPALELKGYSFARATRDVLRDISFTIARGERVAVVGPNGAGKSTLLQCLNRILRGGRGTIAVEGRPLERYTQRELAQRLAWVPQAAGRSGMFSVREFVEMARYPHQGPLGFAGPADGAAVLRALEDTGTAPLADRPLAELSGGERQLVFLAAALAQEAGILLLDEPAAFLDPPHKAEVFRAIARAHAGRDATVLFVTHDVNDALAHASRILALRDGALVFDGAAPDLPAALPSVFGHEFVTGPHPKSGRLVVFPE